MFRRTVLRQVHLFSALLPTNLVKGPALISPEHMPVIDAALKEAEPLIGKTDKLQQALVLCQDVSATRARHVQDQLEEAVVQLRAELYKKDVADPFRRLQIHEAIMAAGFYQRAANPNVLHGEGTRFVLNHFNFDVRRDTSITKTVHDAVLSTASSPAAAEKLLADLLLLERKLFGQHRLTPTGGRRWLCLGVPLEDIKTEDEVNRLLALPAIQKEGNFSLQRIDNEKGLWFNLEIEPKEEPCFLTARDLQSSRPADRKFVLTINKPIPPLTFWENVREKALRLWVIWLSLWLMFFMVDEEIIAFTSLIVLKWKQTRNLEKLAAETGEKVYVARSTAGARKSKSLE